MPVKIPTEEHVQRALDYLRELRPRTTYVVSLQTMVLCRATPADDQDVIGHNVEWLEETQLKGGPPDRKGGWSYGAMPGERSGAGDGSNSQFALLALYEAGRAAEAGQIHVTIHRETWERIRTIGSTTSAMTEPTAPGVTTRPARHRQHDLCRHCRAGDLRRRPPRTRRQRSTATQIDGCYRAASEDQDRIERGVDWLRRHFTVQSNPPSTPTAVASGITIISTAWSVPDDSPPGARSASYDWYREGADLPG